MGRRGYSRPYNNASGQIVVVVVGWAEAWFWMLGLEDSGFGVYSEGFQPGYGGKAARSDRNRIDGSAVDLTLRP